MLSLASALSELGPITPSSWYSVSSSPYFPPRAPQCSSLLLLCSRESFNFTASPLQQQHQQQTPTRTHSQKHTRR